MRTTRTTSAMSTLRGVRTTTMPTIRMGSPRILDTVCGASKNDYSTQTWIGLSSESENNIR